MDGNLIALDTTAFRPLPLVYEYGRLAMKIELSQSDQSRMAEILGEAINDGVLTFWICQVDHFVAHELGHLRGINKVEIENQVARLQEFLGNVSYPEGEFPAEDRY